MNISSTKKLPQKFYKRDVLIVARDLLGKILVKRTEGKILAGKIVEVEAYHGSTDEAAHTWRGETPRNKIMFGEGGFFYVYFTYGAHFCCNVVTGLEGEGSAVLIRAVEPVEGEDQMIKNRYSRTFVNNQKEYYNLTSGPGKLCQAFGINRNDYGIDLTGDTVYLINNKIIPDDQVVITRRVGITRSTELPWRFYIKNNPFVSRK
jgi:DNA-3-methyladenine glycosylase